MFVYSHYLHHLVASQQSKASRLNRGALTRHPSITDTEKAQPHIYPWLKFGKLDSKWWREHHVTFFDWVAQKLNLNYPSDWYSVDDNMIRCMGGPAAKASSKYLRQYLKAKFPDTVWEEWRFNFATKNNLPDESADRKYFDQAAKVLGLRDLSGWYRVTKADLEGFGGTNIFLKYKDRLKLLQALRKAYPEHTFHEWLLDPAPSSWWKSPANQKLFLDHLFKTLGLSSMQDWYEVDKNVIRQQGGSRLVAISSSSMEKILRSAYPEHEWDSLKFKRAASNSLAEKSYQLSALEEIGKTKLGISQLEDWYRVRKADFHGSKFLSVLLRRYNGSLAAALKSLYPKHNWQPWRFNSVPKGWWKDQKNLLQFFEAKAQELGVRNLDDWYLKNFNDLGIYENVLSVYYGSWMRGLMKAYPEHQWDFDRFRQTKSS